MEFHSQKFALLQLKLKNDGLIVVGDEVFPVPGYWHRNLGHCKISHHKGNIRLVVQGYGKYGQTAHRNPYDRPTLLRGRKIAGQL